MSESFLTKDQAKVLFRVVLFFVSSFGLCSLLLLGSSIYDRYAQATQDSSAIDCQQTPDGNCEIEASTLIRRMEEIEKRADSAVTSAELILSFLEGATVLLGIAIGAAAIYGFSQVSDIRKSLEEDNTNRIGHLEATLQAEIAQIRNLSDDLSEINDVRKFIQSHGADIQKLPDVIALRAELENRVENVTWLLQANQEFALNNREQAYAFAKNVLDSDAQNPLALYISGWIEGVYLDNLEEGLSHLAQLSDIIDEKKQHTALESDITSQTVQLWNWATAQAAYGVLLRKKGRTLLASNSAEDGKRILRNSLHILKTVLAEAPTLMDFNQESFWGPVGGIYRALEEWENSMNAYEKALFVTPRSSYPQGNYAALKLRVAKETGNISHQEIMEEFEKTIEFADAELLQRPTDYYLLMDLAMPEAILNPTASKPKSKDYLQQALNTNPSIPMLNTSLNDGWKFLLESCPDDWHDVKDALNHAIERMTDAIAKASQAQSNDNVEEDDGSPHQS